MRWMRSFFQRMFTAPPFQGMSLEEAKATAALLTVALYADGEPNAAEVVEFESELFGIPQAWSDESVLREHIRATHHTIRHVGIDAAIPALERLGTLPRDYLLLSAVLIADDQEDGLTDTERQVMLQLAAHLEIPPEVAARILDQPRGYLDGAG